MFALAPRFTQGGTTGNANRRFKAGYTRTFELTLIAAATLHVVAFLTVPPMTIAPYRMARETPPVGIELPDQILVPPPPPPIARPFIPDLIIPTDTASLDAIIPPNDDNPFEHPSYPGLSPDVPTGITVFDQRPVPVVTVKPEYPDLARAAGAMGRVEVEVVIDVTGRVSSARVVRSNTIPVLNQAALAAARQWLFTPARQHEHPVRARIVIPFEFGLN